MRLIDADAACEATYREVYLTESEQAAYRAFIRSQPTADAVFVTRCKDCIDYIGGMCFRCGLGHEVCVDADDFCSRGVQDGNDSSD